MKSPFGTSLSTLREIGALLMTRRLLFLSVCLGAIALLPFSQRQSEYELLLSIGLAGALAALTTIDVVRFRLPDVITWPLLVIGVALVPPASLPEAMFRLAGAMAGYILVSTVALIYRRIRQRDGIGLGDAKLLGVGGAWCSLEGLAPILLIATVSALLVTLAAAWARGSLPKAATRIAFGPFLSAGIWIVWLFGVT